MYQTFHIYIYIYIYIYLYTHTRTIYTHTYIIDKAYEQFPRNKNRIWVIKSNFFFPFPLSLVWFHLLIGYRVQREALHPALQFLVQNDCPSTSARQAVCRSAAHNTTIQRCCTQHFSLELQAAQLCLIHENSALLPADKNPIKQPHWQPVGESMSSKVWDHTSPFFDQRIKLSFASEPNSVLF